MKKLYDEIMALEPLNSCKASPIEYFYGFEEAQENAAELAKKYDDEIERLNRRVKKLEDEIEEANDFLTDYGRIDLFNK